MAKEKKEKKEKFDFIQPIKDIPKCFKGFPKNIVHIGKDPVTKPDEVGPRKKEIYPFLYLFVGLFLIMAILSVVIPNAQSVCMIIGIVFWFGIGYCVFLLVVLKKAAQKFADLECPNCKKQITYDKNVRIEVAKKNFGISTKERTIEQNGIPSKATVTVSGKESVTLKITCKCQECGTEKTFTHDFVTLECEKAAVQIPYVTSGATRVQYESDMRKAYDGDLFEEYGVKVDYRKTPESLVRGYFGNEIQMR